MGLRADIDSLRACVTHRKQQQAFRFAPAQPCRRQYMEQQDKRCHDKQQVYLLPISTTSSRFRLVGSSLPTRALCSSTAPASNRFLCSFVTIAVLATTPTAAPAIRPALLADSAQNHEVSYMSADVPRTAPMQDVVHRSPGGNITCSSMSMPTGLRDEVRQSAMM